jgi:hypothetical protein
MFGHHKQKRENRRAKREKQTLEKEKNEWAENSPERQKEAEALKTSQVNEKTNQAKNERTASRAEGKKYAEEVLSRDIQGLSPEKRNTMQYEANKSIQRNMQQANRKLLGEQASHGIGGRGGVGYAQQRDLQKVGTEAQGQVHRDLDKLNEDLALKKLAAMFNIEQGEASQGQLDKQMALDELKFTEEQKKNKMLQDQLNEIFNRL